jgi:AAA+ superfamily predicted ATPase
VAVNPELFGNVFEFPDPAAQERFAGLVGIEATKERLVQEAVYLLDPDAIAAWSRKHHGTVVRAATELTGRTPLIVLAGDVGTGKTELAESFLDPVSRIIKGSGTLYSLSLSARGRGAVGEMTNLISQAFGAVRDAGRAAKDRKRVVALLIDEGDALAQSRELAQMHHEDRAGVNALIRGVDDLRRERLPVLTILCTNRPDAVDPALKRRAAATFALERPNDEQRRALLDALLEDLHLSTPDLDHLVAVTGPNESRTYGMTYSDIRQRLLPEAVLHVMPDAPLTASAIIEVAMKLEPTRPFTEAST